MSHSETLMKSSRRVCGFCTTCSLSQETCRGLICSSASDSKILHAVMATWLLIYSAPIITISWNNHDHVLQVAGPHCRLQQPLTAALNLTSRFQAAGHVVLSDLNDDIISCVSFWGGNVKLTQASLSSVQMLFETFWRNALSSVYYSCPWVTKTTRNTKQTCDGVAILFWRKSFTKLIYADPIGTKCLKPTQPLL